MTVRLIDLHDACARLNNGTVADRLDELSRTIPSSALVAIGGMPFQLKDGIYYWCGSVASKELLKKNLLEGLGVSAVLTYTNPKNKSLLELGKLCNSLSHHWAYHWITVSIVFAGFPREVELAFARDTRFRLSWTIGSADGKVFVATGGIKEWLDYTKHMEDDSFDLTTRKAMKEAYELLKEVISND